MVRLMGRVCRNSLVYGRGYTVQGSRRGCAGLLAQSETFGSATSACDDEVLDVPCVVGQWSARPLFLTVTEPLTSSPMQVLSMSIAEAHFYPPDQVHLHGDLSTKRPVIRDFDDQSEQLSCGLFIQRRRVGPRC